MMAENHPNDIELLEYAEGDLDETAATAVRAHLAVCSACAAEVAAAEHARSVLQATPLLELPASRRERVLASLPEQEREASGLFGRFSRRRLLVVLAPAAVGAAVAIAVVSVNGNGVGGDQEAAPQREEAAAVEAAPPAEPAPPTVAAAEATPEAAEDSGEDFESIAPAPAEPPAEEAAPGEAVPDAAARLAVGGTPEEVLALLEEAGLEARIVGAAVEVTGATEDEVASVLEELGPGGVSVTVIELPAG
jgi:hypothetical protein